MFPQQRSFAKESQGVHQALFSRLADLREQLCQVSPPNKDFLKKPSSLQGCDFSLPFCCINC